MSDGHRRLAEAATVAADKGCVIVHPRRNELFIDIDSAGAAVYFKRCFEVFTKTNHATITTRSKSPSGAFGREHIVVKLDHDITDEERILLQACLASDPLREMLSLMRLRAGDEAPTIFFEKKKQSKKSDDDDDFSTLLSKASLTSQTTKESPKTNANESPRRANLRRPELRPARLQRTDARARSR